MTAIEPSASSTSAGGTVQSRAWRRRDRSHPAILPVRGRVSQPLPMREPRLG